MVKVYGLSNEVAWEAYTILEIEIMKEYRLRTSHRSRPKELGKVYTKHPAIITTFTCIEFLGMV